MKKTSRFLFKIAISFCIFISTPNPNWGQDLLLSTKVIGKVKKCVIKTHSVKASFEEIETDELLYKEAFEYYLSGKTKSKTIFGNQPVRFNYAENGQLVSVYYRFSDTFKPLGIDSIIYDLEGKVKQKCVFELRSNKWVKDYIYDYKYDARGNLTQIVNIYISNGLDISLDKVYPDLFNQENLGFVFEEKANFIRSRMEENSEIWNDNYGERLNGQKNPLESNQYFREATLIREYDQVGNWTKTTIYAGKKPFRVYLREITYYE